MKGISVEAFRKLLRSAAGRRTRARKDDLRPEERFALELRAARVAGWLREHRFDPPRRWRFDFAWPTEQVALEIHGGVWTHGRHTRGHGFTADREKMNRARALDWWVVEATSDQVRDGKAMAWILEALEARRAAWRAPGPETDGEDADAL